MRLLRALTCLTILLLAFTPYSDMPLFRHVSIQTSRCSDSFSCRNSDTSLLTIKGIVGIVLICAHLRTLRTFTHIYTTITKVMNACLLMTVTIRHMYTYC